MAGNWNKLQLIAIFLRHTRAKNNFLSINLIEIQFDFRRET